MFCAISGRRLIIDLDAAIMSVILIVAILKLAEDALESGSYDSKRFSGKQTFF